MKRQSKTSRSTQGTRHLANTPAVHHYFDLTAVALLAQAVFAPQVGAQGIVVDGRTQTTVFTAGNVSTVTTSTVSGNSAFNSFSSFNVGAGATANLVLPNGAANLVNLVRSQISVDGVVNSIKNGSIGGNVFFASSQGFVVSAGGVLNVGSLSVLAPTPAFISGFFGAGGVPKDSAVTQLLDGTAPMDPHGQISIQGQVNAIKDVSLRADSVAVGSTGLISAGASFSGTAPEFTDVVNAHDLVRGAAIIERDGKILITAAGSVTVEGALGSNTVDLSASSTSGGAVAVNLAGADVAGRDLSVVASSTLDDATLSTTLGINQAAASAHIDISGGRLASENGGVVVDAISQVNTSAYSSVPTSVAVLRSSSSATVNVHNGAAVSTTVTTGPARGNVRISAQSGANAVATPGSALANLNGDAMAAVTDVVSTASVHIGTDAGDTAATPSSVSTFGALSVSAVNAVSTTATANAAAAGSSAAGATVAVSKVRTTTQAIVDRGVNIASGGALSLTATSLNNVAVAAQSSATGAQEDKAGTGRASQTLAAYGDQAKTSEGGVKVAGAVAVSDLVASTRALLGVDTGTVSAGTLEAAGAVTVTSLAANVATVVADASATGGKVGVGVAVGLNLGKSANQASVGQSLGQTRGVQALHVAADMAPNGAGQTQNQFVTTVASGAGASNVGVAGALGVNAVDIESQARVLPNVAVAFNASGAALLSLQAKHALVSTVVVAPTSPSSGAKVGIGASVAVNVVANRSLAELGDGASVTGAGSVDVSASGDHEVHTEATAGSAGGVAITPSAAVALVNNSTKAVLGTGAAITARAVNGSSGDITLVAQQHATETTMAAGSATGGTAAVGAAVAVALVNDTVLATSSRNMDGSGDVSLSASGASLGAVSATASAAGGKGSDDAGEDASVDSKLAGLLRMGTDQQAASGVGDADQQSASTGEASDKPSASTSEGKVAVAAAVGVNLVTSTVQAILPDSLTINAGKGLTLSSVNNTDGQVTSNGTAVGTAAVGIGAAVAINHVKSSNQALLGDGKGASGITVHAGSVSVSALKTDLVSSAQAPLARTDQYLASATAGAGSGKVGIAGALALNLIDTESLAQVGKSASVTMMPGGSEAISLSAENLTSTSGQALPADGGASGSKVGIGASVAVNIVANRSIAEVQDTASLSTNGAISLSATGVHAVDTEVEAGASGGVAITPAVAVALINNTTQARLGRGDELVNPGAVTVSVEHTSSTTTSAKGSAEGEKAAIGAALGLVMLNDVASATIERNIDTATGAVSVSAQASSQSANTATASAMGGKSDEDAGATDSSTGEKKEDASVDDKVTKQTAFGKKAQTDNGVGDAKQQAATSKADDDKASASSDEGKVSVAAAVAVNIVSATATAKLADGVTVKTAGALAVSASGNTDSSAISDGSTVGSTAKVGIGAAVSVNKVDSHNEASLGRNTTVSAHGITLAATMTDVGGDTTNTISAEAKSGAGASNVGIAASLALNLVDTSSKALILGGAGVDAGGDVALSAEDLSKYTATAAPTEAGGASGDKVAIGASVALNLIDSASQANIGASAGLTNAGKVTLSATTQGDSDASATAGAVGGKLAFDAAAAVTTLKQSTDASISAGADIATSSDVALSAKSSGQHAATAVGTAKGGTASVGAAVGVITSTSTTTATIDRNVKAGGTLGVAAESSRFYDAGATASAGGSQSDDTYANNQSQADKSASSSTLKKSQNGETNQGTKQGGKVNIAAAVGVVSMEDDVNAAVTGGRTIESGANKAMSIAAKNASNFSARGAGDAVDPKAKVGVGVGVGMTIAKNSTTASLAANTHVVRSGDLTVQAISSQNTDAAYANKLTAEGLAGAGGSKVGVAGAFAVAYSKTTTSATIGDASLIDQSGALSIDAENTATLSAKAWAGAIGSIGVGAAVATVVSDNDYTAALGGGSHVTASSLEVKALNHQFSPTPFSLDLSNLGNMTDKDSAKTELTDLAHQFTSGKLLGGGNYYTEAAAGAAGDKVAVAGSFAVNVFKDVTDASIGAGSTVATGSGAIELTAGNDTVARSLAGSLSVGGQVGVGISTADVASTNVTRSHIDAGTQVTQSGAIKLSATNTQDIEVIGVAGGVAGSVAVSGVANVITLDNTAEAFVAGSTTTLLNTSGAFEVGATNTAHGVDIATGLALSGSVAVGVVGAVNTLGTDASHQFTTHAYIGDGVTVNAGTSTTLNATASQDMSTFAIAGAASGSVSVGGAAVVNVINSDTRAYIGDGAKVNKAAVLSSQSASLSAQDTTTLFNVVVGAAAGGSVGVGASADVAVITKSTQAHVDQNAWVETAGKLLVQSRAREDFRSIAIGLGIGGSAGGAGSVSAYSLTASTKAFIGDNATVRVGGSALVSADDESVMNLISGSASGGGSAAIGAAAGVTVFDKTTQAFIGDGADVDVLGNGASGISAANGDMAVDFGAATSGHGQVKSSAIAPKDAQGNAIAGGTNDAIGERNAFQALTHTRTASPVTTSMRGLAVTATNRDKLSAFSVTGAAGGAAAVTLGANVAVLTTDTEASIGTGAKINQNGTPANSAQSVRVAAGSDQFHLGLAGAASGAGGAAIGVGADVIVANNTVKATIGANAKVKAVSDVEVLAHGQAQFLEMGAGLAGAGSVAVAGSVGVISLDDKTYATVEGGSGTTTQVNAGGQVRVVAGDDTEADMIAGAAAAGFGVAGVGVAVGVNTITKDTQSNVGEMVAINAAHGLQVQASSTEDLFMVSASGAAGLYAGVSGAVTVTVVKSDTQAVIGNNAKINLDNTGAATDQDVNVSADNDLKSTAFTGSVAVGAVGLSGGVDVFTAKNNTHAAIGDGAQVHAQRDVAVNASSSADLNTLVVSAAGGGAALAAGVSVYSVGDKLGSDAQGQLTSSGDVMGEANSQAKGSAVDDLLKSSTDSHVQSISAKAQSQRAAVSTASATTGAPAAGNSASIGHGAIVVSGRDTSVKSHGDLSFHSTTGAAAVGALGLGAGIGIADFSLNNQATIDSSAVITAGRDLLVHASLAEEVTGLAFAGTGGIVAVNAAWSGFTDTSTTTASMGTGVTVHHANNATVEAADVRTLDAQAIGASVGAVAGGASIATTSIKGSTSAFVASGAVIGSGSGDVVDKLTVSADSRAKATSSTLAAAGGISLAATGSAATATAAPTVTAYVDGGKITLTGEAIIKAAAAAGASADALGFSVSGGVGIGASVALARSSPQVKAYLGQNTVLMADALTVSASHERPDFVYAFDNSLNAHVLARSHAVGTTVRASASGTSGGLLFGATGTEAEADYGSEDTAALVSASVGEGSSLTVPGALTVSALNNSSQDARSSGLAIGIVAVGSNDAYARSNSQTYADIGKNVSVAGGITGQTRITAQGLDSNVAQSVSGSGGVIAGAAASANTVDTSDTRASVGDMDCGAPSATCGIATGRFTLSANHETNYNAKVDSTQASVAGASGALNTHKVSSVVNVNVGKGAKVSAGNIALAATNTTHKYWWGQSTDVNSVAIADAADWNVNSASGGLLNLPAGRTVTTIDQRTQVSTGENSLFHVLMLSGQGANAFSLDANNVIVSYDKTKLDSGGAIALAESNSMITAGSSGDPADTTHPKVNAIVSLGKNSTITSDSGDINVGSRTLAKLDARAVANAYGLAGAPSGKAYVNYFGTNTTTVGQGALLLASDPAYGAINVSAGDSSTQQGSSILAHTAVNLWNKTAIPINSTPDARTNVTQNATVNLGEGSHLLAGGDIGLAADRGNLQVSAVGVGKDLYREVAAAIAGAIGIDVSLDIKGGSAPAPGGVAQVNVDGTVLSGILRQSATQIDPVVLTTNTDGSVIWQITYAKVNNLTNSGLAANPLDASLVNPYISALSGGSLDGQIHESDIAPSSQLKARISLLQGLLAQYAADPVSRTAYQSEIDFLTKKLGAQGVGQTTTQVTAQGAAALGVVDAVVLAVEGHPVLNATHDGYVYLDGNNLVTGNIASTVVAEQKGAVGGLVDAYKVIDANNTVIDTNLLGMKNAPTTPSTDVTYTALGANRSQAESQYQTVRTAVNSIGHYNFICSMAEAACSSGTRVDALGNVLTPSLSADNLVLSYGATGLLGDAQNAMQSINQLALSRVGTGSLVDSVTTLQTKMSAVKQANSQIVTATQGMATELAQAAVKQAALSTAWKDTAAAKDNVDLTRVSTVATTVQANAAELLQFDEVRAGSHANVLKTNAALFSAAVDKLFGTGSTDPTGAVHIVSAASNTPPVVGSQKLLSIPDITVRLGNVNVQADVLTGAGSLEAPGDAKIWILNNAPASMNIGNLTVDAEGGNVRLNGFLINDADDVKRFNPANSDLVPTIISRENGAAGAPEIKVVSTYNPEAYYALGADPGQPMPAAPPGTPAARRIAAAAPDITLGYRANATDEEKVISNPSGLVSVDSAAGDIYVDGSITAGSVSILASNGDFVQQYVNGFNSVAGEPNSNVQGGSGVLPPNNTALPGKGIVANGNVFVSARYLNINGLVQSGIVNYHLDIPTDAQLQVVVPGSGTMSLAAYVATGQTDSVEVAGTHNPNDPSSITALFNPLTGEIEMKATAKVHGGNITLFGQIINTADGSTNAGSGKLAVLDGFGQVAVNNLSSHKVVLKTIDTGADPGNSGRGVVGTIDITDVQSVDVVNGLAVMNAIHTLISRDQDEITVQQTGFWNADGSFNQGDPSHPLTSFAANQNSAARVTADTSRLGTYKPQAGLRYVYTTGTDTSTKYTWRFSGASFFGTSSLSLPPDNVSKSLTSGPNILSNYNLSSGTYLSYITPLDSAVHQNKLAADTTATSSAQAYQQKAQTHTTNSTYQKIDEWNTCNWWTLCIASRYTSIWDQTVGATSVTTNSVKADYPINIEFMGANKPSVTVSSPLAAVSLADGSQLNNRYGDTLISATAFSAGSQSLINTRNLSITASNGSIGAANAPINVLMSGTLTASATAGNVIVNQVAGSLKVDTVSASGDPSVGLGKVALKAQGDIHGDANNLITAERIELTSANGAIGGISGNPDANLPLNVATGYTSDLGQQQFYGLQASASGDIGIDAKASIGHNPLGQLLVDTVVSKGGDVRLTAPGQILDNNPDFTIDTRVWSQLNAYWGSVGLLAGQANSDKVAQALLTYESGRTQRYAQYWQIRNSQAPQTVFDASWRYQATPGESTALKNDAAAIAQFENVRTAQYWTASKDIASFDANALARGLDAAQLKTANPGWTQAQIDARVRADEAAGTLPTATAGTPISGFAYVATSAEADAQATGATWTTTQLALGLNPGLLKDVTDTNPVLKAPNVSGRHVNLVAGTSIGSTLPASDTNAVVIALNTDGNLTDREKRALATAEFSDFVFSDPSHKTGTLTINQRLPVNFSASAGLSASVNQGGNSASALTPHVANTDLGNVYLTSLGSGLIDKIVADGEVRLKVKGPISAVDISRPAIYAGDLILEAANGTIGGNTAGTTPLWVSLSHDVDATADSHGSVTARGVGSINLTETDDLAIGGIFSRGAITVASSAGSILNARPDDNPGLVLLGGTVQLSAPQGSIGKLDVALGIDQPVAVGSIIGTTWSGFIQAQAGESIYLEGPSNPLVASNFTIGAVVDGADALNAGTSITLVAKENGRIDGHVVAPGAVTLSSGKLLTVGGDIQSLTGNIAITADRLTIEDQGTVRAETGTVHFDTVGDAIVTGIFSGSARSDAVVGHSSNGRILDGGDTHIDITAKHSGAVVGLVAKKGVGNGTVQANGSIDGTVKNPLELEVDAIDADAVTGDLNLSTQGTLKLNRATAPGDINLFGGTGVLANSVVSSGGGITVTAPNGSISTQEVRAHTRVEMTAGQDITAVQTTAPVVWLSAKYQLSAGTMDVSEVARLSGDTITGTIRNVSNSGLLASVSGPDGTMTRAVTLDIVDPNSVVFDSFQADFGQLNVSGPGALAVKNGVLGTRLDVVNPLTHLVVDTRNNGLEKVDIKLYVPSREVDFSLLDRALVTRNFVLQRGPQYMTDAPGGRNVSLADSILDEIAKTQFASVGTMPAPKRGILRGLVESIGSLLQLNPSAPAADLSPTPLADQPQSSKP